LNPSVSAFSAVVDVALEIRSHALYADFELFDYPFAAA
jgi:hypothetical protein